MTGEVQDAAVESRLEQLLELQGAPASLPLIIEGLKDPEWRVRKAAIEAGFSYPDLTSLIPELVTALADPDNVGRRNAAAELLAGIGDRAVPVLILKLEDQDPDVRLFATNVLGEIRSPAAINALTQRLKDPEENVRLAAVERLGLFDDPAVDAALIGLLETGDIPLRFAALEALAAHDARIPVELLKKLAAQLVLRPGVYRALRSGRQPEAASVIAEGVLDRAKSSREAATVALSELVKNFPELVPKVMELLHGKADQEAVLRIAQALSSEDITLRRAAVDVLGLIPSRVSLSQLIAIAEDDDLTDLAAVALARIAGRLAAEMLGLWDHANDREKALLARAFGTSLVEKAVPKLLTALDSSYGHLIASSAKALGDLSAMQAVPDIAILLAHPYPDVRRAAAYALQRLAAVDSELVGRHVLPHANADVSFVRSAAVMALAAVRSDSSGKAILRLLKDPESEVRTAALTALNPNFLDLAFDFVAPMLADESPEVRRSAVEALGKLPNPRASEILESALSDSDLWVRIGAVRSLGIRQEREALAPLLNLLKGKELSPPLVSETLKAIERRNPDRLVEAAGPLLTSSEVDVVLAALDAMTSAPAGTAPVGTLTRLLAHEHWDVRSKAAQVFALHAGEKARPMLLDRLRSESDSLVHRALRFALDQIAARRP